MADFLKFFSEKVLHYPMHFSLEYNKTCDWILTIWKKGCGENGSDLDICFVQHPDLELVFAKAQVELKEFLLEHEGGY